MKIFRAALTYLSKKDACKLMLVMVFFLALGQLNAQGWVKKIGGSGLDQAEDLETTSDGGYVLLGFKQTIQGNRIFLIRTDIDGTELWSNDFGSANVHGYEMVENTDGSILVVGDRRASAQADDNVYLLKVNHKGEELWDKELAKDGNQTARDVIAIEEGGYLIVGHTDDTDTEEDDILLIRIDSNGNEMWSKTFGQDKDDLGFAVTEVADGYVFTGISENENGADNDILTIKVDKAGDFVWQKRISSDEAEQASSITTASDGGVVLAGYQGNNSDILVAKYSVDGDSLWAKTWDNVGFSDQAQFIKPFEDGGFLLTGLTELSVSDLDAFVARVDGQGELEWLKTLGSVGSIDQGVGVDFTLDGGFIVASTSSPLTTLIEDILLFKTDADLNTLTNRIEGRIAFDMDGVKCETDGNNLSNNPRWVVVAEQGDTKFFGTTDNNGTFHIDVGTGTYVLSATKTSELWTVCNNDQSITFDSEFEEAAQVLLSTSINEESFADIRVDISTPNVFQGSEVFYDVVLFNDGTEAAHPTQTKVEIQLDEELTYVKTTKGPAPREPESNLEDGFLVFFIPSLPAGGTFNIQFTAQAKPGGEDMRPLQAVSVRAMAEASNNNVSTLPQDLQVSINQVDKEINIRNIGIEAILKPVNVVVVQDIAGFLKELDNGIQKDETIDLPFDEFNLNPEGQTLRVIATVDGEGLNGMGTSVIEAFGRNETNTYSTGFVSMFPEDDQDRNVVIDVQENIGSLQDFELRGYPKGYKDSLIAPNTDLTYTVFFKNTGSDTINRLVIRDTLSELLDPNSVRPGASNLPYQFEIDGSGIAKFTFDNIELLPGSSAEIDSSSYGYVKFVVSQKPDLPNGSVIQNRAAVFFDYFSPVNTNEVTHTIGEYPEFIEFQPLTDTENPFMEGVEINIYPNPFTTGTTFELKGREFGEVNLIIFDLEGKLIESYQHFGNKFMYYRNHELPSGMYLYRLESEGQLINSGKLMVR